MASHMGVQKGASARNSQVEFTIHFVLQQFINELQRNAEIKDPSLSSQKQYSSSISSDVWDHHISAMQKNGRELEIWCQTTCYKGNKKGTPEPNKTYEVRETLVEGISIREHFLSHPNKDFRSIHFTVGDSRYTYQWFMDMKAATFDFSTYLGSTKFDVLESIVDLLNSLPTEAEKERALLKEMKQQTLLGKSLVDSIETLNRWWKSGHKTCALADKQWDLVKMEREIAKKQQSGFKIHGLNIKGRVNNYLFEESPELDNLIIKTTEKVLKKKPFLVAARKAVDDWNSFCSKIETFLKNEKTVSKCLAALWRSEPQLRLVVRRLILRIHTADSVDYIQDRNIKGITEHNLYSGDHSEKQVEEICAQIEDDLKRFGIKTKLSLVGAIKKRGKSIINQSRWLEAKNGTNLKPSFDYVQLMLIEAGYQILSGPEAKVDTKGYNGDISKANAGAYDNLKVVKDKGGNNLCILKAKFFRRPEFPRRCKEESYVGLTMKYAYENEKFNRRSTLPLVMFVDMESDISPPTYALTCLRSYGWTVIFYQKDLLNFLKKLSANLK